MASRLVGNLSMGFAKVCSGLLENCLKYLLPRWMSAPCGTMLRVGFGAVAFWIMGWIWRKDAKPATPKVRLRLFLLGAFVVYGFITMLMLALTYTTPITTAIFGSTEPVWVFIMCLIVGTDKWTRSKGLGIALGLGGALICILTQKTSDMATNPLLGCLFALCDALLYSFYLVYSAKLLKSTDVITYNKWTFLGASVSGLIVVFIVGWDAPVVQQSLFSTPMLILLFVLLFPTCLSYLLVAVGLKSLSSTVVALYGYVILITTTVVSYITGQDKFDWWQILAIAMICTSVYFVEIAEAKTRKARQALAMNAHPEHPMHHAAPTTATTKQPTA